MNIDQFAGLGQNVTPNGIWYNSVSPNIIPYIKFDQDLCRSQDDRSSFAMY